MKRKSKGDVEYYKKDRKRPIAYSTTAVSDFLMVWNEVFGYPTMGELRSRLDKLVGCEDEKVTLDKLIAKCGKEARLRLH